MYTLHIHGNVGTENLIQLLLNVQYIVQYSIVVHITTDSKFTYKHSYNSNMSIPCFQLHITVNEHAHVCTPFT